VKPRMEHSIVPQYWAEARLQQREARCQVTMRRFGWSDSSQRDAQTHAGQRAREALAQGFAACRLVRAIGDAAAHSAVLATLQLHDEPRRARSAQPIA
jgi:hypothetical protein